MNIIHYQVGTHSGKITWAASEYFGELTDKTFSLGQMEATQIASLPSLSLTAKLLLSAVAGAIIQRLLDQNIPPSDIFEIGTFTIK